VNNFLQFIDNDTQKEKYEEEYPIWTGNKNEIT
jgi:hypothetical protein